MDHHVGVGVAFGGNHVQWTHILLTIDHLEHVPSFGPDNLAFSDMFMVPWKRTAKPFAFGLKAVVQCKCRLTSCAIWLQMAEVNCEHLSDDISEGTSKREIHTAMMAWAQVKVAVLRRVMATGHRVVLSTMVKIYENPLDGESVPTKSMFIWLDHFSGTTNSVSNARTWYCILDDWQDTLFRPLVNIRIHHAIPHKFLRYKLLCCLSTRMCKAVNYIKYLSSILYRWKLHIVILDQSLKLAYQLASGL